MKISKKYVNKEDQQLVRTGHEAVLRFGNDIMRDRNKVEFRHQIWRFSKELVLESYRLRQRISFDLIKSH